MDNQARQTILLVEDEALIAMTEKIQLEAYGYLVYHVSSGEKAIEAIHTQSFSFDLILMDINLGSGIDGTDAALQILKLQDIPIVFLSSHTEAEVVEKTEKITSYGYVVKGSSITVIVASIKMAFKLFDAKQRAIIELNERLRAEEALQEKTRELKYSQKVARLGYYSFDALQGSWSSSEMLDEMFGIDQSYCRDVQGWLSLVHPDDQKAMSEYLSLNILKNYEPFNKSYRIVNQISNQPCWVQGLGTLEFDSESRLVRMFGTIQDISLSKSHEQAVLQAKEKAEENELYFRTIFENSSVAKSITAINGTIRSNKAFADMLGYPFTDFQKLRLVDITHPADRALSQKVIDDLIHGVYTTCTFEKRYIHQDGSIVYAQVCTNLQRDNAGNTLFFISTIIDITGRKQAEAALDLQRNTYEQILEQSLSGYWDWYIQEGREYLSPTFKKMFGYADHEMENSPESWQKIIFAEDLPRVLDCFSAHATSRGKIPFYNEVRYRHKDGSTVWVICTGRIIQWDENDQAQRMVGCHIDISDRKKIEENLVKQLAEKDVLLREIHHRVKNNIANIEGLLMLQAHASDMPQVKDALQDALSRVQSMRVLYDKLLASNDPGEISLKVYIEELIESLRTVFVGDEPVTIEMQMTDFSIESKHAITIGIIVNELMTNVFKYAFKGQRQGKVVVSISKVGKQVQLQVQDNGIGIVQNSNTANVPGFGLKLVAMLVEQLKGRYTMFNEAGTKTVIQFEL